MFKSHFLCVLPCSANLTAIIRKLNSRMVFAKVLFTSGNIHLHGILAKIIGENFNQNFTPQLQKICKP